MRANPPILLLIDLQKGFEELAVRSQRNNPSAEANAAQLLELWRTRTWPIIHVHHDSVMPDSVFRPERPGNAVLDFAAPNAGEPVLRKTVNSGFIGTDLADRIRKLGSPDVMAVGATTDHCVSTTVRMGANLGFRMVLAGDACFTFDRRAPDGSRISAEAMHAAHLASLSDEFARVVPTADLLAELTATQFLD
jgi:nicotinamidase-related amidase